MYFNRQRIILITYFIIYTLIVLYGIYWATSPLFETVTGCEPFSLEIYEKQRLVYVDKEFPVLLDLSKLFFSVSIAVFLASITFWEKILGPSSATALGKGAIVGAWVSVLFSILGCGVALALASIGYDQAVLGYSFEKFPSSSLPWYILSGASFAWGLILFLLSAVWSINHIPK